MFLTASLFERIKKSSYCTPDNSHVLEFNSVFTVFVKRCTY